MIGAETDRNRLITVKWEDGTVGQFPVIWLKDCSTDDKTYSISPAMIARNLWMRDFDVRQNPQNVQVEADGRTLVIDWDGEVKGRYSSEWLRLRNPSCEKARQRRRKVYLFPEGTWDKEKIERRLKKFDFNEMLTDDKTLHDFLEAVCLDGIVVLRNGPGRGAVNSIGARIGLIHNTHFGRIFEVSTKSDASNMAYRTDGELPFHTDFPSLSDPPQLQMLHMVQRAAEGGNSLFVDGFHVAKLLKEERPDVYDLLTSQSMEYIEEGYDIHDSPLDGKSQKFPLKMIARHKVIKTDDLGRVCQIQFGNAMRSWFYDCEPEKVQSIYDALKVFTEYCYQNRNVLKFQLQNGETVLWANTRLLHTRDAFRNADNKPRVLEGCYFSWDIVKSKVRHLRTKLNLEEDQPSA